MQVKEMEVFSDPRFRLPGKLDFNFIRLQAKEMIVVVDDLKDKAYRQDMDDHSYDENISKKHDELLGQHDQLLERCRTAMKKVSEHDENEG